MTDRKSTQESIRDGFGGDTFRRKFEGDRAQCGCEWRKDPAFGDVLELCPIHRQATDAFVDAFLSEVKP